MAAINLLAERLDGKVPQPTGDSDELGPQGLHISWASHQRHDRALAAPALTQGYIDGETEERDPEVRRAGMRQAGAAQEPGAQGA